MAFTITPEEVEEREAGEDLVGGEHVLLGVDGHEGAERRQGHDDRDAAAAEKQGCQIAG